MLRVASRLIRRPLEVIKQLCKLSLPVRIRAEREAMRNHMTYSGTLRRNEQTEGQGCAIGGDPPYGIRERFAQCTFLVAQVEICQSPDFFIYMLNNPSNCCRLLWRLVVILTKFSWIDEYNSFSQIWSHMHS